MKLRAVLVAASLFSPHAWAGGPDQCTDLSAVAPFTQIRYEQIQNVFSTDSGGTLLCLGCHPGNIGAGNLGLASEFSYGNLVGVPSDGVPGMPRVSPGDPLNSLLFFKLNCDNPPGLGDRMPLNRAPLSVAQQALFFDWIRLGAPLSRLGFEDR